MTKEQFWEIMNNARFSDTDIFFAKLESAVGVLSDEDRKIFRGYASAYMEAASDCVWVDMACKVINGYVSDDTGLYFALWLVSQGEDVLLEALKDPDSLGEAPIDIPLGHAEFEMLMAVGFQEGDAYDPALMEKCAQEIAPSVRYKNGDKYGGYDSFEDAMSDIPNVLPKLIERAKKNGFDWEHMYDL